MWEAASNKEAHQTIDSSIFFFFVKQWYCVTVCTRINKRNKINVCIMDSLFKKDTVKCWIIVALNLPACILSHVLFSMHSLR